MKNLLILFFAFCFIGAQSQTLVPQGIQYSLYVPDFEGDFVNVEAIVDGVTFNIDGIPVSDENYASFILNNEYSVGWNGDIADLDWSGPINITLQ